MNQPEKYHTGDIGYPFGFLTGRGLSIVGFVTRRAGGG